jgi:NAD(P)-dependent dehydrogenase (short-subunit alcohol dehydrogenase family)
MRMTTADVLIVGCDAPFGTAIAKRLGTEGFNVGGIAYRNPEFRSDFPTFTLESFPTSDLSAAIEQHWPGFCPQRIVVIPQLPPVAPISDLLAEELISSADEALVGAEAAARYLLSTRPGSGPARLILLSGWAAMGLPCASTAATVMGGLLGLTRSWALELAPSGITVNAVVAGAGVLGSGWDRSLPPIGRHPTEEDVAHAVAFFLDERSGAINGQVLFVCGGRTPGIIPI